MMRLYSHPKSPYVQKVLMAAYELDLIDKITLHKIVVAPVYYPGWSDDTPHLSQFNPLAKIPTLVLENGLSLYDSSVICEYLDDLGGRKLYPRDNSDDPSTKHRYIKIRTMEALMNGVMDAAILCVYEERLRKRSMRNKEWISGQWNKINRGLDAFNSAVVEGTLNPPGGCMTMAEISGLVVCSWMEQLGKPEWKQGREALGIWFAGWKSRDSFVKTMIDWESDEPVDTSKL
jgi:glutathione S-transferase